MLAQVAIDLAAQYEGNGVEINTPELEKQFVDEAIRRTGIIKIQAIAGLGVPFATSPVSVSRSHEGLPV